MSFRRLPPLRREVHLVGEDARVVGQGIASVPISSLGPAGFTCPSVPRPNHSLSTFTPSDQRLVRWKPVAMSLANRVFPSGLMHGDVISPNPLGSDRPLRGVPPSFPSVRRSFPAGST
jgi:hypothetical protein